VNVSSVGRRFPCPVCAVPQEVRSSKKDKPYITCNTCGVQVFVRGREGVQEFKKLLEQSEFDGTMAQMRSIVRRYRLRCKSCGRQFWIAPPLVETSFFDGSLSGVRCPQAECGTVNEWKDVA
jgi:transcription elongation factor Elf1